MVKNTYRNKKECTNLYTSLTEASKVVLPNGASASVVIA